MNQLNQKDEIIAAFEGKECVYNESRRFSHVKVKSVTVDDWGITFELSYPSIYQASEGHEFMEYCEVPEDLNRTFEFSGAWEIASFHDDQVYIAYVGGRLNNSTKLLEAFKRKDPDLYDYY